MPAVLDLKAELRAIVRSGLNELKTNLDEITSSGLDRIKAELMAIVHFDYNCCDRDESLAESVGDVNGDKVTSNEHVQAIIEAPCCADGNTSNESMEAPGGEVVDTSNERMDMAARPVVVSGSLSLTANNVNAVDVMPAPVTCMVEPVPAVTCFETATVSAVSLVSYCCDTVSEDADSLNSATACEGVCTASCLTATSHFEAHDEEPCHDEVLRGRKWLPVNDPGIFLLFWTVIHLMSRFGESIGAILTTLRVEIFRESIDVIPASPRVDQLREVTTALRLLNRHALKAHALDFLCRFAVT